DPVKHFPGPVLPRGAVGGGSLPPHFDRSVTPWPPGHPVPVHALRAVLLPRHHHRRAVHPSRERQHDAVGTEELTTPDPVLPFPVLRFEPDDTETLPAASGTEPRFD